MLRPTVPDIDVGRIGRLRNVYAGGHLAFEADRQLAGVIAEGRPWLPRLVRGADEFHRRAARWAVTGGTPDFPVPPAAGVIFAAAGLPVHGGFHGPAQAARPDALFAYADPDPAALAYNLALLVTPDPGHVGTYVASARDPLAVLGNGHAAEILARGPVQLQLQLCAHWWKNEFAAWTLARFAELLRAEAPGSTIALSVGVRGDGEGGEEFAADLARAGGEVRAHSALQVARWIRAARMRLAPPGIRDVPSGPLGSVVPPARVVEAVALVA